MIHDSILDTIGNTPIVKLHRLAPKHVELYVKVEAFNPAGSVKDRLALAIILDAEQRGTLKPGQTVIEATSGNTGVALAAICAARGSGMVAKAVELAQKHGWFFTNQFENPANPAYHRQTTAPEILRDFAGRRLDYFVTGWGTGGTLTGVGEVLKVARPEVRIIASEPAGAGLLSGKEWQPHKIQGWTPDFVPAVLNRKVADQIVLIDDVLARDTSRQLAQQEGIFTGISSGATLAAALLVAADAPQGSVLLAMLPDTGERYLSTFLFEGVNEGSDEV